MNKAFIFDMDGVLVDSEQAWEPYELPMLQRLLGESIASQIGDLTGNSIRGVFEKARELGSTVTEQALADTYTETALRYVYPVAKIADNVDYLVEKLLEMNFSLALLTNSPMSWVEAVLSRLSFRNEFKVVLSLREQELPTKPAPDGYLEVTKQLAAEPSGSFALEDSNPGIRSAKAAGIFVIGFRGLLPGGYEQEGADAYAETMDDVMKIVATRQ